jgi:hypothetical protein
MANNLQHSKNELRHKTWE